MVGKEGRMATSYGSSSLMTQPKVTTYHPGLHMGVADVFLDFHGTRENKFGNKYNNCNLSENPVQPSSEKQMNKLQNGWHIKNKTMLIVVCKNRRLETNDKVEMSAVTEPD